MSCQRRMKHFPGQVKLKAVRLFVEEDKILLHCRLRMPLDLRIAAMERP